VLVLVAVGLFGMMESVFFVWQRGALAPVRIPQLKSTPVSEKRIGPAERLARASHPIVPCFIGVGSVLQERASFAFRSR
jgi:hypothetical protein